MSITNPRPASPEAITLRSMSMRSRRLSTPQIIVAAVVAAVLVNIAIWAVGAIGGGSFEYTDGDQTLSAAPGGVVFMTALPLAVGLTLAAVLARRWLAVVRIAQVLGPLAALATIGGTLGADFDTASTVALALCHVTLVPITVLGLAAIRDRTAVRAAS